MSDDASMSAFRSALRSQYHAALAMLRQAIEVCPDELWVDGRYDNPFWQIAYHTLYYVHLYVQPDAGAFTPWDRHQTFIQDLDEFRAPPELQDLCELPHRPPRTGEPYSKAQVLEYWALCDAMVDDAIEALDLLDPECGFPWYDMSKADHQFVAVRHIQHHTAQLGVRLRENADIPIDWVGAKGN